jgi:sterol desaturase/sphingolipid hydroxylase (fatty acid hydroxylase superfamily)
MVSLASWDSFVDSTGLSDRLFFVVGTVLSHVIVFWGCNLILYFFYKYDLFPKQRINRDVFPSQDMINENIRSCLLNHFIVQPIILYFAYDGFVYFGMTIHGEIPPLSLILRDYLVSIAINDTLFYWFHRLAHHPSIYKYVHKHHHRYNHSIGIAAEFAHPLEDALCNILPTILGCLLLGSHIFTFWSWLTLRLIETIDAHSGYAFSFSPFHLLPFQGGSERHYFHHSHNVGCYGSFTIFWDWITGTDSAFLEHQKSKNGKKAQ